MEKQFCNSVILAVAEEYIDFRATNFVEDHCGDITTIVAAAKEQSLIMEMALELSDVIAEAHQVDKEFSSSLNHLGYYALSISSISSIFERYVRIRAEQKRVREEKQALEEAKRLKTQTYSYE